MRRKPTHNWGWLPIGRRTEGRYKLYWRVTDYNGGAWTTEYYDNEKHARINGDYLNKHLNAYVALTDLLSSHVISYWIDSDTTSITGLVVEK